MGQYGFSEDHRLDRKQLVEMEISVEGKGYVLRAEAPGMAGNVAQAAGVVLPPVLRPCLSVE